MIETMTSHAVEPTEMREWLEDHGLDIDMVKSLVIEVDRPTSGGHPVWLHAVFYKTDEEGRRFLEGGPDPEAATGAASIPVKSWPPLKALVSEGDG